MFGNPSWFSIYNDTTYPFNCVFRKCFNSFFIPKEDALEKLDEDGKKEEEVSVDDEGKKEATSEREIGDTSEIEDEDKFEDWEFAIILYILSYFWVGAFTKSFIFGIVNVVLKKWIKWWISKINIIDKITLCNIQNSIWLV